MQSGNLKGMVSSKNWKSVKNRRPKRVIISKKRHTFVQSNKRRTSSTTMEKFTEESLNFVWKILQFFKADWLKGAFPAWVKAEEDRVLIWKECKGLARQRLTTRSETVWMRKSIEAWIHALINRIKSLPSGLKLWSKAAMLSFKMMTTTLFLLLLGISSFLSIYSIQKTGIFTML